MYVNSINERKFNISATNEYLSKTDFAKNPVIGAWAPSMTWGNKAISYPVWKGYFNHNEAFITYIPAMVITEFDEEDSNQEFSSRGISLKEMSDSIYSTEVNRYKINLYWIGEKAKEKSSNNLQSND